MANENNGNTNERIYPKLGIKTNNPELRSVLSKLVPPDERDRNTGQIRENRPIKAPDMALLQRISEVTTANVADAASIFQLLPDLEIAMQILVSSIISPKDMVATTLNFSVDESVFNSELAGALLQEVKSYFECTYKIGDILPKILEDALFMKGAYPLLVLPESHIDHAINSPSRVTMESISGDFELGSLTPKHIGFLENSPVNKNSSNSSTRDNFGIENLITGSYKSTPAYNSKLEFTKASSTSGRFDPRITVVDNPNILKMPLLKGKLRQDRIQDKLALKQLSMEAKRDYNTDSNPNNGSLYLKRRFKNQPVVAITPNAHLNKTNVGHPLVMVLPAESIIPVHVPADPTSHLGYFVLLDPNGNPIVNSNSADYYTNLATNLNSNKDMVSQLVQTAKHYEQGLNNANGIRQEEIRELEQIYGNMVEDELKQRLANGLYGDDIEVARPTEIYRVMLARAFSKMQTQILYVPAEMMTYIAFDYSKYGIGTSLIAKSKIVGGIRAMLLFANTMASIKNSVGRTQLNITLDPQDPDPSTTVEFMIHEYVKTRQGTYPLGASNPMDIISFLQNAAVEVAVSGNQAYPETKLEVEDKGSARIKPDSELEKDLRDKHLHAIGISPETVDAGSNAEFATTVLANNLLLTKRVMVYQKTFTTFLEEFVQKYTSYSGALMDKLRKVISENPTKVPKKNEAEKDQKSDNSTDGLILDFIASIRLKLPSPDISVLENQIKAYDAYVEALDKAIKAYLDAEFLEATEMGELQEVIAPTLAAVRAHYLRQWLRNNNVLPELDALTTFSEEDGPAMDLMESHTLHIEGISKTLTAYMKRLLDNRRKNDKKITDVKDKDEAGSQENTEVEEGSEEMNLDDDSGLDTDIDETGETDDSLDDTEVSDTDTTETQEVEETSEEVDKEEEAKEEDKEVDSK